MSNVKVRLQIERIIVLLAVKQLLAAGYSLGVYDGEEITIHHSKNAAKIEAALFTTDEDYLYVYVSKNKKDTRPDYWVRCTYGNDGWDVISDYSTHLEMALTESKVAADRIEAGDFRIVLDKKKGS